MKKLFFAGMFIPLFSLAQNPSVISITRFFPKNDKIAEFEKAAKNHAQKYHTGEFKWRTYTVETGPEAGGYMMIEGPATWDQVDKRGTLGADHTNDLYRNVMPTVEKTSQYFISFREDLSSVGLTDYVDKVAVTHVYPKPGKMMQTENDIRSMKKVWDESKQSVAVYEASSSGPGQFYIVYRYKDGLKERETGFRKPVKERYELTNGAGSYDKWLASIAEATDNIWGEMLFYNAELSSK
ncbi:MAG TPA: hypothetical protein VM101_04865 [Flavitalea sp.]|nr:hypothetical protein [Flavitalea sp.]